MALTVVVPWRPGCPHRAAALDWVLSRYHAAGTPVVVAEAPAGAWCKARAVAPAIAAADTELVAVADADVWTDGLSAAAAAVEAGAPWAIPHRVVHRLAEDATAEVLAGADWHGQPTSERPYTGVEGGGVVVARRQALLDVPLDERFVGWGQEDQSWAHALNTLLGPAWRGTAPLVHLYHPPQPRMTRRRGSPASWRLFHRYRAARRDPAAMRALLEEADADLRPAHPALSAAAA